MDRLQQKAERELGIGVAQRVEALGPEPRVGVDPGEPAVLGKYPGPSRQLTLERVSVRPRPNELRRIRAAQVSNDLIALEITLLERGEAGARCSRAAVLEDASRASLEEGNAPPVPVRPGRAATRSQQRQRTSDARRAPRAHGEKLAHGRPPALFVRAIP